MDKKTKFAALIGIILLAAFSRLIPHPFNFTPIAAMALFGGAYFNDKRLAFAIPLLSMFLSDVVISYIGDFSLFNGMRMVIYSYFIFVSGVGISMQKNIKPLTVISASVGSSILFFTVSNFVVWATDGVMYPMNAGGLIECYVAAIPFFRNTLFGDLFYSGILFGAYEVAKLKFPKLANV